MQRFLKKYIAPIVPLYAILPLLACAAFNSLIYYGTMALSHLQSGFSDLTTAFDRMIPLFPPAIFIYGSCFGFWALNYVLTARTDRRRLFEIVSADMVAKVICLLLFVFFPTTNARPILAGNNISELLLLFVYRMDQPVNLLPSIHCLNSWLCFIGMRGNPRVPRWYQIASCIFALAICASTLLIRQHVIADVIVGVALAEGCYRLCRCTGLARRYDRAIRIA